MLVSCASDDAAERPSAASSASSEEIRRLFAAIELGASRSTVEALLGVPKQVRAEGPLGDVRVAWYLEAPALDGFESPYAPGAIEVRYLVDRVVQKRLNPQVRR